MEQNTTLQAEPAIKNEAIAIPAPFVEPKSKEDFANGQTEITNISEKGTTEKFLLISGGTSVAKIREGKGKDVERATMEANGDQSKYLTSMMAACVLIDGKKINMFDLSELPMKDYMKIQLAFADINF